MVFDLNGLAGYREHLIPKPWGLCRVVVQDDTVELMEIHARRGGYCSRHFHRDKDNLFWVLSGTLKVTQYVVDENGNADLSEVVTVLEPHDAALCVAGGVQHRFEALTDVVAVELYRPRPGTVLLHDDIVRFDEGGYLPPGNPR